MTEDYEITSSDKPKDKNQQKNKDKYPIQIAGFKFKSYHEMAKQILYAAIAAGFLYALFFKSSLFR